MPHKDPEARAQYWKDHYARNRDRHLAAAKRWREANPERAAANSRAWRARNPEKSKEVARNHYYRQREKYNDYRRQRRTGATREVYDALFAQQGGLCAICKRPPGRRCLQADHCHTTGKVRGLLCFRCNPALGLLSEDIAILQAAIDYITHHAE